MTTDRPLRVAFAGGGSGGHLYPALAVARALEHLAPGVETLFLGSDRPLERKILAPSGYPHRALPSAPWRGIRHPRAALRFAWSQARGVLAARALLADFEPDVVLGLGGFASVPGALAAWLRGTPLALFEPNAEAGLANRVLAPLAREAYLHFPDTTLRCRGVLTGAPVGERALAPYDRRSARARLGLPQEGRVLLVMGGSQGARGINAWIERSLAAGAAPAGVAFLHLAGNEEAAAGLRAAYAAAGVPHVVLPFLADIALAYAAADAAVVRAGAATLAELSARGLPGVAVPLAGLAGGHQVRNACAWEALGGGAWVRESALTPATLAHVCAELRDRRWLTRRATEARAAGRPNAAREVARRLLGLAGRSEHTPGRHEATVHLQKTAA